MTELGGIKASSHVVPNTVGFDLMVNTIDSI